MTKRSRHEREQRDAQNVRVKEITADWERRIPPEQAAAFARQVEEARARGPRPPQPDMAPGTAPIPRAQATNRGRRRRKRLAAPGTSRCDVASIDPRWHGPAVHSAWHRPDGH